MATVQITTWDEFKTALTETITEATTYEIMNDIDVSDTVLSSAITLSSQNYRKTFQPTADKEYITINGITAYSNINIFYFQNNKNNPYTFKNIHFTNIMHTSGTFLSVHTYSDTYRVNFNNCMFSGMVRTLFGGGFSSSSPTTRAFLARCSMNVKCRYFFTATYTVTECYIKLNPLAPEDYNSLGNYSSNKANSYFYNCYLCGVIRNNFSNSIYMLTYAPQLTSNVYNIDTYILNYDASTTYKIVDRNLDTQTEGILYNIDKFYNGAGEKVTPTFASYTSVYGLTDSQMKSKTYIQENTYFPLYG